MASCSSTTVEDDHVSGVSFPQAVLENASLTQLMALASREPCVKAWKELPLTERLEIAESLLMSPPDETLYKCLSLMALFSCSETSIESVQHTLRSGLDRLSQALPLHARAQETIAQLRLNLYRETSASSISKWIPPAIVVSAGIALLLFAPPRLAIFNQNV